MKMVKYSWNSISEAAAWFPRSEVVNPRPVQVGNPNLLSQVGFADAFATRYFNKIRYVREDKKWLIFDNGTGWRRDQGGEVLGMFAEYFREIYESEASRRRDGFDQSDTGRRKLIASLGTVGMMEGSLKIAGAHPDVAVSVEELDNDPDLLGVKNGVVNLRDGSFQPHSPDLLVTRRCTCDYDPYADCRRFIEFLQLVQPDPEIRGFLQRLTGYTFTGHQTEHILPFHLGRGGNGKGTFLEKVLMRMLGEYARKLTDDLVYLKDNGGSANLEISGFRRIRFGLGDENARGGALNERLLKGMTGGDVQKGRGHYQDFQEYEPSMKLHLVGNHLPRINGTDDGIWRRFFIVPWNVRLPDTQGAVDHPRMMEEEFSGILNWVLIGAQAFYNGGTLQPDEIKRLSRSFREESDTVGTFLRERTTEDPDGEVTKATLYEVYQKHCEEEGIQKNYRLSKKSFGIDLKGRGVNEATRRNVRLWTGIRLAVPDCDV
jgi:putative DNA primase/helicase